VTILLRDYCRIRSSTIKTVYRHCFTWRSHYKISYVLFYQQGPCITFQKVTSFHKTVSLRLDSIRQCLVANHSNQQNTSLKDSGAVYTRLPLVAAPLFDESKILQLKLSSNKLLPAKNDCPIQPLFGRLYLQYVLDPYPVKDRRRCQIAFVHK